MALGHSKQKSCETDHQLPEFVMMMVRSGLDPTCRIIYPTATDFIPTLWFRNWPQQLLFHTERLRCSSFFFPRVFIFEMCPVEKGIMKYADFYSPLISLRWSSCWEATKHSSRFLWPFCSLSSIDVKHVERMSWPEINVMWAKFGFPNFRLFYENATVFKIGKPLKTTPVKTHSVLKSKKQKNLIFSWKFGKISSSRTAGWKHFEIK